MSDDWKAKYEALVDTYEKAVDKRVKDVDEIIALKEKLRFSTERVQEFTLQMRILRDALIRFKDLAEADMPGSPPETIIRCEVTAGDIRAAIAALDRTSNASRKTQ